MDYLSPVESSLRDFAGDLALGTIGRDISFYDHDFEGSISKWDIALVCVPENRLASQESHQLNIADIRKEFYRLFRGNWSNLKIIDFGTIYPGSEIEDTYYAIKSLSRKLMQDDVIPIFIGGSQDLMLPLYRSLDDLYHMVNVVNVDMKFDLGVIDAPLTNNNFVGKMVVQKPYNLFNYSVLGYQTYFQSQEEIKLFETMYFDAVRLGALGSDIHMVEPYLRDADIAGVDMRSLSGTASSRVNGLDGREICAIMRYAGISDRVKLSGIFEVNSTFEQPVDLIAQMLWYFCEGYTLRNGEYPVQPDDSYTHYTVPLEEEELQFYESTLSGRWWMVLPFSSLVDNKPVQHTLLSCTRREYENALRGRLPERWLAAQRKNTL